MAIKKQRAGRVVRLSLRGALAIGTGAERLTAEVRRALRRGAGRIVVDASGLTYIDASGLGELVACRALARRSGARFVVAGASGKSLETLRMTGLDGVLIRDVGVAAGFDRHVA